MPRWFPVLLFTFACAAPVQAHGLLIPSDKQVPPLAMVHHQVDVAIQDQAAVTTVTQVFRNSTSRALEATYIFPVPKGASVNKFTMWVDGKEVAGEMVEADKARNIYTEIVRRTQDPGLLEYVGNNLLKLRVFPVPPNGDQKLLVKFTSVAERDSGLVEYTYPLKTDGKAVQTLEKFTFRATLKAQHAVQNVYSPSHPITIKTVGDREVEVSFEKQQGVLDKDLQLIYALGDKDVGLTALTHRSDKSNDGTFMLLVSPRAELSKSRQVPRDMVFVLDTSGSMSGVKMEQARKAMKYCVNQLGAQDRFALVNFASTVNKYRDGLTPVNADNLDSARKWIDALQATGGTAIDAALTSALDLRTIDSKRTFTVVFFTDGMPTIGETNPDTILSNVTKRNTSNTRIFTFGVGDDVNAVLLDRLAQQTRAVSTYVRPSEDIEVKVSGLYEKISHPVLTNLKLTTGKNVTLKETYPTQLPDLFHGGQLIVLGKYSGDGPAALTLTGQMAKETKEFVYEVSFPKETNGDKAFVEDVWARRKVGYLLDQIRANGEQKELIDEVVGLAKKHGITTPYTSYLVVPDNVPTPVLTSTPGHGFPTWPGPSGRGFTSSSMPMPAPGNPSQLPSPNLGTSSGPKGMGGFDPNYRDMIGARPMASTVSPSPTPVSAPMAMPPMNPYQSHGYHINGPMVPTPTIAAPPPGSTNYAPTFNAPLAQSAVTTTSPVVSAPTTPMNAMSRPAPRPADDKQALYLRMRSALANGEKSAMQSGGLGVEVAQELNELQTQARVTGQTTRQVFGRTLIDFGGVWIDLQFDPKATVVCVKAQSDAYFKLLEKHPKMKEVFQLGNRVVWITPSGTVLIINGDGKEQLSEDEIAKLFASK